MNKDNWNPYVPKNEIKMNTFDRYKDGPTIERWGCPGYAGVTLPSTAPPNWAQEALNKAKERKGDWIETASSGRSYIIDPRPEDFNIEDIAHALSNNCRFGGHTRLFYSVAEHSVNVAEWLYTEGNTNATCLVGLLHDASEAYLVDIPSPVKPYLDNYKQLEEGIQTTIYRKFCAPGWDKYTIKEADVVMLYVEGYQLMPGGTQNWTIDTHEVATKYRDIAKAYPPLECLSPQQAKQRFLLTFKKFSGT